MLLPRNNLRRHIVRWLLDWTPQKAWTNDMMADANILVKECQRLLPYVMPVYLRITSKPKLRDINASRQFDSCLRDEVIPRFMHKMREWILSCPFVRSPMPSVFNPISGDTEYTAKIRYGALDSRGTPVPAVLFELVALQANFRNWLGPNGIREERVSDLMTFVSTWGKPDNIVIMKGRSNAEKYAYVTACNPITWGSPI